MNRQEMIRLHCKTLRLSTMAAGLAESIRCAEQDNWPLDVFLAHLLEQEVAARQTRRIERLRLASKLPPGKTFTLFDEKRLPLRIRRQLPYLQAGDFVNRAQNVLCFGLPGTGKTQPT
jgi:DNA replication protein DnaC